MKKVAISQSNYIPWKGYFDLINSVDEFVILDCVQYTRRDWRNRNKIKTPNSSIWLTVPVLVKGKYHQKINEVIIEDSNWYKNHWRSLEVNYKKAKYFKEISIWLEPLYLERKYEFLSDLNKTFIKAISSYLNIETKIITSDQFKTSSDKSERILDILKQLKAATYFSGPAAKEYIDEEYYSKNNILIHWMDYGNYPEYKQLWGSFIHEVSILDLLFNCGKDSILYF